jgi:hypothetical protein
LNPKMVTNLIHGHAVNGKRTPTYVSWAQMKQRCTDVGCPNYRWYGARGISVCARWLDKFDNFLADMGHRPKGTTLDRYPDKNGNYEPGNCRWATPQEQADNRNSKHRVIDFGGLALRTYQWDRKLGFYPGTIQQRLRRGWSERDAITLPRKEDHRKGAKYGHRDS